MKDDEIENLFKYGWIDASIAIVLAQQALEALGSGNPYHQQLAAKVLRTALEQQAEPVPHAVIAGALFDFMGWLTTRKERLILSSTDDASPAADAIKVFAEMRGLSLDDARVQDWQNYTTQQQAELTCPDCKVAVLYECVACSSNNYPPKQQAEPVAVERWLWIFEDWHGDRYTHKTLFYTADEAAESARICGVKSIKKIESSKVTQQAEPVAFYVYKPTLPRGHLGTVSDGDLPWVYDQDPSSGFSARMLVAPVTSPPAQRPWVGLTDEEILSTDPWEILRADPWMGTSDSNINPYQILLKVRTLEAKLKERNT